MTTSGRMDMLGSEGGYDLKGGYVGQLEGGQTYRYQVTGYPKDGASSFSVQADLAESDRAEKGLTSDETKQIAREAARERAAQRIAQNEIETGESIQFQIETDEVDRLITRIREPN